MYLTGRGAGDVMSRYSCKSRYLVDARTCRCHEVPASTLSTDDNWATWDGACRTLQLANLRVVACEDTAANGRLRSASNYHRRHSHNQSMYLKIKGQTGTFQHSREVVLTRNQTGCVFLKDGPEAEIETQKPKVASRAVRSQGGSWGISRLRSSRLTF